jgi:hypothetical protein
VLSLYLATLLAAASPRVAVAMPDALGFDDAELPLLQARLQDAVGDGGAVVVDVGVVDVDCVQDTACLRARVAGNAALLVVAVSRVGADVEVGDVVFAADGTRLGGAHRSLTIAELEATPLSAEATAALVTVARMATTGAEGQRSASTSAGPKHWRRVSSSALAIGAGTVTALAALAGFAHENRTLEDRDSAGVDKERARITAWLLLGGTVVGVGGAVVGGLLLPTNDAPLETATTTARPSSP